MALHTDPRLRAIARIGKRPTTPEDENFPPLRDILEIIEAPPLREAPRHSLAATSVISGEARPDRAKPASGADFRARGRRPLENRTPSADRYPSVGAKVGARRCPVACSKA